MTKSTEAYSLRFQMVERPWHAGLIVFSDGQAKLNRNLLRPDYPVVVHLEGVQPTKEQIEVCRTLWAELRAEMDFRVATFCDALLPHCSTIIGNTTIDGAA